MPPRDTSINADMDSVTIFASRSLKTCNAYRFT
jgi:hypothetical protein